MNISPKNTKVFVTAIKFNTTHYLANLLAMTKIIGIPLKKARTICKEKPGEWIEIDKHQLISKYPMDNILAELDEYEIEIRTLNQ